MQSLWGVRCSSRRRAPGQGPRAARRPGRRPRLRASRRPATAAQSSAGRSRNTAVRCRWPRAARRGVARHIDADVLERQGRVWDGVCHGRCLLKALVQGPAWCRYAGRGHSAYTACNSRMGIATPAQPHVAGSPGHRPVQKVSTHKSAAARRSRRTPIRDAYQWIGICESQCTEHPVRCRRDHLCQRAEIGAISFLQ